MIVRRLQDILARRRRRRSGGGSSGLSGGVLVVAGPMVAGGCEATVCLTSRRPGAKQQRSVVLCGIGTGDIIWAPESFFDDIVERRRIPNDGRCRLWRGRRNAGGSTWVRPRTVPCQHHVGDDKDKNRQHCERCPWMGLTAGASREIKAERLRRAIESLVYPSYCSSINSIAVEVDERRAQATGFASLLSIRFLEPFGIPFVPHSMREMEFFWQPAQNDSLHQSPEKASSSVPGKFCFSTSAVTAPNCLLCTLEQQRLLSALNRWAERLPTAVQKCLCAVFILQHRGKDAEHSWEFDMHLTLLLRRDSINFGEQTPLCGSLQSGDGLSFAEQQLVDAVTLAVPLTKRLGIATLCSDGSVSCLYPRFERVDFSKARSLFLSDYAEVVECLAVSEPCLGKTVTAKLPFIHSSVVSVLGARDTMAMEFFLPSLWRHNSALEATGSLLLSTVFGELESGDTIVLFTDNWKYWNGKKRTAPEVSADGGTHLLGAAFLQWLGGLPMTISVVHVAGRVMQRNGRDLVDLDDLRTRLSLTGKGAAVFFWFLSTVSDVDAVVTTLGHCIASERSNSLFVRLKCFVIVQLSADGSFDLLEAALRSVNLCLEGQFCFSLDSGVVDVDPWTAAVLGYVLLKLSPVL